MPEPVEKEGAKTNRGGVRPGSGRKKGTPNRVTSEAREAFTEILRGRAKKVGGWIDTVAKTDPARAADLVLKLAEFTTPKVARTELLNAETGETIVRVVRE